MYAITDQTIESQIHIIKTTAVIYRQQEVTAGASNLRRLKS